MQQAGAIQRSPEASQEMCRELSEKERQELEKARFWKGALQRWLRRVKRRDLNPKRLTGLRSRRANRVLLLECAGELEEPIDDAGGKLNAFIEERAKRTDQPASARDEEPEREESAAEDDRAESASGRAAQPKPPQQRCAGFTSEGCDPPRELSWEDDFREVDPGSLDPRNAQVESSVKADQEQNIFIPTLGGQTLVEEGKQSDKLLVHERIHWKIACLIGQLANKELEDGQDIHDVKGVVDKVHRHFDGEDGYFDLDTGHGVSDAIPKVDWPREWCKEVERVWEENVGEIRTITIEPLP